MFVCPITKSKLSPNLQNGKIISYTSNSGTEYKLEGDIPNFHVSDVENSWVKYYAANAESYDDYNHITFELQGYDEYTIRQQIVDLLELKSSDKILELGCGTGRDSILIAKKSQNAKAKLHCVDASFPMINKCKEKLQSLSIEDVIYAVANGENIPFEDNYFDHFFSFVAFTPIPNKEKCLKEIARVVKPGGKVILGSEGLLPSLKKQEFGKKILSNCDLYNDGPPLDILPIESRNISLKWILNGIIYILEFDIEKGEVEGNFNQIIKGKRGGSINSRYYGNLSGVSKKTKELFEKATSKSKKSKYDWLSDCITNAAKEELK